MTSPFVIARTHRVASGVLRFPEALRTRAGTSVTTLRPRACALRAPSSSSRQPVALCSSSAATPKQKAKTVNITFVDRDGDEHNIQAKIGMTLLEVAKEYDIDLEGACEGTLSCSTCHLIVDQEYYEKIPDPLTEEEQDMLDLAYGLTDTSRLGCQILVSKSLEGIRLTVPAGTSDARNL